MTRINCVPVENLTSAHLRAEYREMLRLRHAKHSGEPLPNSYRLGRGHLKFFYNKGQYLISRHGQLVCEMRKRGFDPKYDLDLSTWPSCAMGGWMPSIEDALLNMARILRRTYEQKHRMKILIEDCP